MDGRVCEVARAIRWHDRQLLAQRERNGAIHIYRKKEGSTDHKDFVFALTDNWTVKGQPVEWGLQVICNRLRAMDLWSQETEIDRVAKHNEKVDESNERDFKNSVESFLYDFRKQFAKATNGINTGTLSKNIDSRRLKEA